MTNHLIYVENGEMRSIITINSENAKEYEEKKEIPSSRKSKNVFQKLQEIAENRKEEETLVKTHKQKCNYCYLNHQHNDILHINIISFDDAKNIGVFENNLKMCKLCYSCLNQGRILEVSKSFYYKFLDKNEVKYVKTFLHNNYWAEGKSYSSVFNDTGTLSVYKNNVFIKYKDVSCPVRYTAGFYLIREEDNRRRLRTPQIVDFSDMENYTRNRNAAMPGRMARLTRNITPYNAFPGSAYEDGNIVHSNTPSSTQDNASITAETNTQDNNA